MYPSRPFLPRGSMKNFRHKGTKTAKEEFFCKSPPGLFFVVVVLREVLQAEEGVFDRQSDVGVEIDHPLVIDQRLEPVEKVVLVKFRKMCDEFGAGQHGLRPCPGAKRLAKAVGQQAELEL